LSNLEKQGKVKKKSKYILEPPQRKVFIEKILPTLLIGSIIWLIGEIVFSYFFSEAQLTGAFLVFYISMIVVDAVLFLLLYFVAKSNKVLLGLLIFFLFCFIAGIISIPIVIFTEYLPQVHMFVSLAVGANLIVYLMALSLRDRYFAKGYIWAHIGLFIFGFLIVEIVFIIIFSIGNYLLTIPITFAYICVVVLTVMFYGAKAVKKADKIPWLLVAYKIIGMLLLVIILAMVFVAIVLIIIALAIICGGAGGDLSGIGSIGSGSSKKKKKEKSY
jgi:FtsH-binding integral membrane protein